MNGKTLSVAAIHPSWDKSSLKQELLALIPPVTFHHIRTSEPDFSNRARRHASLPVHDHDVIDWSGDATFTRSMSILLYSWDIILLTNLSVLPGSPLRLNCEEV